MSTDPTKKKDDHVSTSQALDDEMHRTGSRVRTN